MQLLREGVQTEEGFIKAEEVDYVKSSDDARLVGIKVHTSKNRVVRNMFEYFRIHHNEIGSGDVC